MQGNCRDFGPGRYNDLGLAWRQSKFGGDRRAVTYAIASLLRSFESVLSRGRLTTLARCAAIERGPISANSFRGCCSTVTFTLTLLRTRCFRPIVVTTNVSEPRRDAIVATGVACR